MQTKNKSQIVEDTILTKSDAQTILLGLGIETSVEDGILYFPDNSSDRDVQKLVKTIGYKGSYGVKKK